MPDSVAILRLFAKMYQNIVHCGKYNTVKPIHLKRLEWKHHFSSIVDIAHRCTNEDSNPRSRHLFYTVRGERVAINKRISPIVATTMGIT